MNKGKIIEFIKEFICYIIVAVILLFIAKKSGWTDTSVIDNLIGLAIGWIIWKVIMILVNRKKK